MMNTWNSKAGRGGQVLVLAWIPGDSHQWEETFPAKDWESPQLLLLSC